MGALHLLYHQQDNGQPQGGSTSAGFCAGWMSAAINTAKQRLIIQAATFCDANVTAKVRSMIKQEDQSFNIQKGSYYDAFLDPWPDAGPNRGFVMLY
jgi:hypothetical protein